MAENRICPDCGGEMPPDTLEGHCPRCLARIVFGAPGDASPDAAPLGVGGEGAEDGRASRKKGPADTAESDLSGQRVGRYKLLEKIGEGGFGIVYMAEQLEPVQRKVALKLIKPGMDSRAIIARFEAERQALALMDHPNIARFYDAGVANAGLSSPEAPATRPPPPAALYGRPYFVMELVRGRALTDYCDQQQLPTRARLELFTQVCQAVQHAHQKGIIHRDLKPSNVLVTLHDGQPVPKIIDFGIAKALDQKLTGKTLFTGFAQLLGTPAYMSPEQAELSGLDIDTRSDIYSLGVLLYELLTSKRPFDDDEILKAGVEGIRRLIREKDPVKPSTRLSNLTVAEQTTVARCRQLNPPRLVHLVRGDLDWIVMRCLEKERSRRYETANGLAREIERYLNQEPVMAAAPSAAYRAAKFARRHRAGLITAAAFVVLLLGGVVVSTLVALQARASERRAQMEAGKSRQVATLLREILTGAGPGIARGRDTTVLMEIVDQAALRIPKTLTNSPLVELELRDTLGEVYTSLGAYVKAEEMFRRSVTLRRQLFGEGGTNFAAGLNNLQAPLYYQHQVQEAAELLRQALRIYRDTGHGKCKETVVCLNDLANVLEKQNQPAEALKLHEESVALAREVLNADDPELASALSNLANCLAANGKFTEAVPISRQALQIRIHAFGSNDLHVADSLCSLADLLRLTGYYDEAADCFGKSLFIQTNLLKGPHVSIATTHCNLANVLWAKRKLSDAADHYKSALGIYRGLGDSNGVIVVMANLAGLLIKQNNVTEARSLMDEVVGMQRVLNGKTSVPVALSLGRIASLDALDGKLDDALTNQLQSLEILQEKAPESWETPWAKVALGTIYSKKKDYEKAEPLLKQGFEGLRAKEASIPAQNRNRIPEAMTRLLEYYKAVGDLAAARVWSDRIASWDTTNAPAK